MFMQEQGCEMGRTARLRLCRGCRSVSVARMLTYVHSVFEDLSHHYVQIFEGVRRSARGRNCERSVSWCVMMGRVRGDDTVFSNAGWIVLCLG